MEHFVKKISISDLSVGMFVEDVFNSEDVLLLSADSLIANEEQIQKLRRQQVQTLYINIKKGKDVPKKIPAEAGPAVDPRREVEYYKELEQARVIQKKTVETAREALCAIRNGQDFSASKVEDASQDIVESILRNPDALISLCQIKGYDEYTYTHSVNVSVLATSLAFSMGYSHDRLLEVGVGGLIHDIGKMRVPEAILNKPGKYTDEEFSIMKAHPELGMEVVGDKKGISEVSKRVVIQHHERYNGRGYPYGLKEREISEIGLISAVADVYDALTSNRVYRVAWTPQKALAVIFQGCDQDYSRDIVERFTKQMGIYPVGSFVRLFSGEMGVVTRVDRGKLLAPTVLILFDEAGRRQLKPVEYNLAEKQVAGDTKRFHIEVSLNPRVYEIDVSEFIDVKLF